MTTQVSAAVWNSITKAIFETATITAAAPAATTNFDVSTQAVQFYTSASANSFIFNLRGDSSTTLESLMSIGQSTTVATLVTCSNSAHYLTAFRIDGNTSGSNGYTFTARWQGGTPSASGNANSIDIYTVNVIKTAVRTYTILASQTKFA
jgi:nucleoside-specific outer membrane channel protein Tsx